MPTASLPHAPTAVTGRRLIGALVAGVLAFGLLAALAPTPGVADDGRLDPSLAARNVPPPEDYPKLPPRCVPSGERIPQEPGRCNIGHFKRKRPTVVIWGDSQAWQHIPGLRREAKAQRVNLVAFVMGTCPAMAPNGSAPNTKCVQNARKALRFTRKMNARKRPFKLIVGGFYQLYLDIDRRMRNGYVPAPGRETYLAQQSQLFTAGMPRLFSILGRRGVPTDVIGQVAFVPDDPPRCSAGETPYACDLPRHLALPDHRSTRVYLEDQIARLSRPSRYIDINKTLCNRSVCYGKFGDIFTFYDDAHISATLAARLRPYYKQSVLDLRR